MTKAQLLIFFLLQLTSCENGEEKGKEHFLLCNYDKSHVGQFCSRVAKGENVSFTKSYQNCQQLYGFVFSSSFSLSAILQAGDSCRRKLPNFSSAQRPPRCFLPSSPLFSPVAIVFNLTSHFCHSFPVISQLYSAFF